jgi:hypothetical protein
MRAILEGADELVRRARRSSGDGGGGELGGEGRDAGARAAWGRAEVAGDGAGDARVGLGAAVRAERHDVVADPAEAAGASHGRECRRAGSAGAKENST